jgi:hypothetical protein
MAGLGGVFLVGFACFSGHFDIDKKRLQSIGLVSGAIVACWYGTSVNQLSLSDRGHRSEVSHLGGATVGVNVDQLRAPDSYGRVRRLPSRSAMRWCTSCQCYFFATGSVLDSRSTSIC